MSPNHLLLGGSRPAQRLEPGQRLPEMPTLWYPTCESGEAKCPPAISCWVDPDQLSAWSQASASLRYLLSGIPHVSPELSGA